MKKKRFVTFGELLLRFSKDSDLRLQQSHRFFGDFGGSEANVAISLATLGEDVEYVTRVPANQIGQAAAMKLRELCVNTHYMMFGGDRMGTYYYEGAAGMRSSKVVYDRDNSAFYTLQPSMFDWEKILSDADVFHASGITGAVSQPSCDATFEALQVADRMGKTISFDMNYRKNLWKYGGDPRQTLSRMLEYADIVFGDVIEYEFITGHRPIPFEATSADYEMDLEPYRQWFDEIHARFPRCKRWLMGMRNTISSNHHTLTALLWSEGRLYKTRIYDVLDIVDAMGVGDAFMAGILHAREVYPDDDQRCLDYSLAAATLKYSITGDFNLASDEEILELMRS